MGRTELEKAKTEQEQQARKWRKKEVKRRTLLGISLDDLAGLSTLISRVRKATGYRRHQGDREKARRVRQIERGIIDPSQVLRSAP